MELLFALVTLVVPVLVIGYVIWLLTRLTQAVERIEERIIQLASNDHEHDALR